MPIPRSFLSLSDRDSDNAKNILPIVLPCTTPCRLTSLIFGSLLATCFCHTQGNRAPSIGPLLAQRVNVGPAVIQCWAAEPRFRGRGCFMLPVHRGQPRSDDFLPRASVIVAVCIILSRKRRTCERKLV